MAFAGLLAIYVLFLPGLAFDPAAARTWTIFGAAWVLLVAVPLLVDFSKSPPWTGHAALAAPCALLVFTPSVRGMLDPLVMTVIAIILAMVYGLGRGRGRFAPAEFAYRVSPVLLAALAYANLKRIAPDDPTRSFDPQLAAIDHAMLGVHLSVLTDRVTTPLLTDWFSFHYAAYIAYPVIAALWLFARDERRLFEDFALMFSLGMYLSFLSYIAVPAVGPVLQLAPLYTHATLPGAIGVAEAEQALIERYHYLHDVFPSMHTCLSLVAIVMLRRGGSRLFWPLVFCEVNLLISTVYLREHYTIDILVGGALAVTLLAVCPAINRRWGAAASPAGGGDPPPRTAS